MNTMKNMKKWIFLYIFIYLYLYLYGYGPLSWSVSYPFNSPYTFEEAKKNILFSSFAEQPKHLDPARSYSENEYIFITQIYEPPYQYNYLLRPYTLEPLTADGYITSEYFDSNNQKLPNDTSGKQISYTVYTVKIKPHIFYQPHKCFNNKRELIAADYIYQIKRLADPKTQSPIYGFMSEYIVDLAKLNQLLEAENKLNSNKFDKADNYINLNDPKFNIDGLKLIDNYTYQIKIKGKYPQFIYWFAMPFFAPVPWEADKYYSQAELIQQSISLDTYPVGTGPFILTENNPNQKMVLTKNPNYNHGFYPTVGMPEDKKNGYLNKAGQKLPFLDQAIFYLEKEAVPRWNKFLQGYYDFAGINSDNFNQAISFVDNKFLLSTEMQQKNIRLTKSIEPTIFYLGFNMLDPIVGGYDEKQRKLRQAIGIVFNFEEYIKIFNNGRGQISHDPIPEIIMTNKDKNNFYNKYLYDSPNRKKSLDYAKQLLAEAGYPSGTNKSTNEPLILHFDSISAGGPDDSAGLNWLREQFKNLNITLDIRATQYNNFQEKLRHGKAQMFFFAWHADYPDPENFLFLLLCNQSKVNFNGENSTNYCNPEYDKLFEKMQDSNNPKEKNIIIQQMIAILQKDGPWLFGLSNELYALEHGWNNVSKPFTIGNNNLKYRSLDSKARIKQQIAWNQPILWPIIVFILLFFIILIPVIISYYRKMHKPPTKI
ncbi:MAG: ABC transporter substrate-binding protein [Gammaproteobacteria bacterium]|nr:ABC transporter substrate-binding protein [Gammaproteobacteria bacterium]